MNYSDGNLMVNTAHKISCLCECIGQGKLLTSPHMLPLSSLHSLPLCTSVLSPCSPSLLSSSSASPSFILFLLCAFIFFNNPIHQIAWIRFPCLLHFWMLFSFFLCQLSRGLLPFCSALFLATCLVLLYPWCFSLISHQHYSGGLETCRKGILLSCPAVYRP